MEKGNGAEGGTQVATPTGSASGTGTAPDTTTSAGPGTGTGTAPAPAPAPSGAGGAPQGSSSAPTKRREILYQGPHVERHHQGSALHLDGKGGAEFVDGLYRARLEGNEWVDPKTGQPVQRGLQAKADYQLRDLEMKRGLRRTMWP